MLLLDGGGTLVVLLILSRWLVAVGELLEHGPEIVEGLVLLVVVEALHLLLLHWVHLLHLSLGIRRAHGLLLLLHEELTLGWVFLLLHGKCNNQRRFDLLINN